LSDGYLSLFDRCLPKEQSKQLSGVQQTTSDLRGFNVQVSSKTEWHFDGRISAFGSCKAQPQESGRVLEGRPLIIYLVRALIGK